MVGGNLSPQVPVDPPAGESHSPYHPCPQARPTPWLPAEALTQWTSNFPMMTAGPKERAGFMEQPVK